MSALGGMMAVRAVTIGGWGYLMLWPAMTFLIVACAYFRNTPKITGKRSDGGFPSGRVLLLLPYLLIGWTAWHLLRLVDRAPAWQRIDEGLTIGRRVLPQEFPEAVDLTVDLTTEFREPPGVVRATAYLSHPILDNHAPPPEELSALVERISDQGHVYIHCAEGHGRAALLSACVLLRRGVVQTPEEAVQRLQEKRPRVRPRRRQWEALHRYAAERRAFLEGG
ncbi:MAG: hypothetical protein AAF191_00160 [Verrucomicrobiota bacterium]